MSARADSNTERAPSGDAQPATGAGSPGAALPTRRFLTALVVLVVLLAVVAGVAIALGVRLHAEQERRDRDSGAAETARDVATRLSSLGQADLRPQVDGLLALSTGPFRAQLANAGTLLERVAATAQFRSRGSVSQAAVEQSDGQVATVLVTAQSEVSNVAVPQGSTRRYVLAISLEWDGTRWLARTVDQVS